MVQKSPQMGIEDSGKLEIRPDSKWRQYYSSFAVSLAVANVSTAFAWTSTAMPDLNSGISSWQPLTSTQESWITAIVFISGTLSCPLVGFLMQKLGFRASMMTLTLPLIGGWVLIVCSTNFWILLIGRFITGFTAGGAAVAVPVFIAETTEPEIRGKLGIGFALLATVGRLYIYIIGYFASWQWQAVACALIPVIFQLMMLPIPESPRTLISQGKLEKGLKSLAWFRNARNPELVQDELNRIVQGMETANQGVTTGTFKSYMSGPILRPTLMCVMLMVFIQTSAHSPLLAYSVKIFDATGFGNSHLATVIVGVVQVVSSFASAILIDRIGRRILLLISAAIMGLSLGALGTYMYFHTALASFPWIPLVCLMIYMAAYYSGFGPVPFVLVGELVPTRAKGFCSAVALITNRFLGFVFVLTFNDMIDLLGNAGYFWLFGGCCVFAFFYVYFWVPETKGKSLEEIQTYFQESVREKKEIP